jgi:predicted AAA+ superfamily ATPase
VHFFVEMLGSLVLKENADVYVTGSNSHFLSSDIATEFRGRSDEIHVYPLSFEEFMSAYEGDKEDGWQEYYTYGGLPKILSIKGDDKKATYLRNLYRTVYLSDIYECHTIENLTYNTISTYIGYLKDAFLIEESERYDIKGRQYIGALSKYYFKDCGLRNAILSFRQTEENHLMENVLYNDLRGRGFQVDVGNINIRVRDENGVQQRVTLEVDFVCNLGSKRYYIQSAWRMPDEDKMEQEQRSLCLVNDEFRKLIVVGERLKLRRNERGITIVGIYDFLLDKTTIDQ